MNKAVLLKDGTTLEATTNQLERINQLILSRTDFQGIKVRLDGHEFSLGDIETDMEKLARHRQSKLELKDDAGKKKDISA